MARRRRQTRDDFPTDLLYSQQRLWIQRGKSGTARLGLAVPAISERIPNIYFIQLRRRGYLVEGQPFGSIDLDTGHLELIAPFSARIQRMNAEVPDDPFLLMTEPFTGGWLYELSRVKPSALRGLLARDAYWDYLEFERAAQRLGLPPVLEARYRLDREAPWPEDLRVTFGGLTVLSGRLVRLGRNQTFTPQWSLRDTWEVEFRFQQPSLAMVPAEFTGPKDVVCRWRYEVVDTEGSIDGESCYVVMIIEVNGPQPQSHYLLHIAKEDFTLRLTEEVSQFDSSRRSRTPNDWGRDTFLELRQPRELILDLPIFPIENRDEVRTVSVPGEPEIRQEACFPDARTMEIACEAPLGDTKLFSEQIWERSLPWWREARRRIGDEVVMTGTLITNGAQASA
jgi:glycine cleavage system H protein